MAERAIVLVGMSVREVNDVDGLVALAAATGATVAFLQMGDPSLSRELTRLIAGESRPVTGNEAGLESAAWEDVTDHRHQVFVCRGPRCTAKGSDDSAEAFARHIAEAGLGDDDVLVTHTGCQFPCNNAPVVSVQPDDIWYGRVDQAAKAIVTDHLIGGVPVESHRLPRVGRL